MTMMKTILGGAAGLAALSMAAPAAAQYPVPYAYANPYAYNATSMATQRCAAAVQQRLSQRTSGGLSGIVGALLGANTTTTGRVVSFTQVVPRSTTVRVRGLASSGANMGYGPYGVGAYGAVGYAYQPDLTFKCDVDYRGYIRDIDIYRR